MDVGFVGLGIMGLPMARNLARGGHRLHLFARRPEALAAFEGTDAVAHASPSDVGRAASIVFTILGDTPDVEAVLLGRDGVAGGMAEGGLVIDMTTASPSGIRSVARALEERGIDFLDAPVSGGQIGAEQGTLSIMIGGSGSAVERARPLFELLGKNVVHVGPSGAGQVAKACNQILAAVTIEGVAEALTFAGAHGVDATKVREALLGGFAYSKVLEIHGKRMLDGAYAPGFKAKLHAKDMRIVRASAAEAGLDLPCAEAASERIDRLVAEGKGELDSSALATLFERGKA